MTHGDAGGGVEGGDDPVRGVNVRLVDVMLATMPRVDRVKACKSCSLSHCDNQKHEKHGIMIKLIIITL